MTTEQIHSLALARLPDPEHMRHAVSSRLQPVGLSWIYYMHTG